MVFLNSIDINDLKTNCAYASLTLIAVTPESTGRS